MEEATDFDYKEEEKRCLHSGFGTRSMRQRRTHIVGVSVLLDEQIASKLSWKERTVTRTMVPVLKQGRLRTHIFAVSVFGVQAERSP